MSKIILAAAAVAILALSTPAEAARRHHQPTAQAGYSQVTHYCGDRVCPANRPPIDRQSASRYDKAPRAASRAGAGKPAASQERWQTAEAPKASQKPSYGSGIVRSGKTGATAHVSPRFAPIAQAIVDDLERQGASIRFMGGYRRGPCWAGGLHPCGLAIDLCQTGRGVVDRRCNLPSRAVEARIAAAHGALSGGVWCNQDRGHVQLGQTAGACGRNIYAAVSSYHAKVRHHGKRVRVAWRRQ